MNNRVIFYQYNKLVFAWPLVVIGIICDLMLSVQMSPEIVAWVYIVVNTLVILGLGVDINRDQSLVWVLIGGLIITLAMLLGYWGFPVLHWIWQFFDWLDAQLAHGFGTAMSILIGLPYIAMLIWCRINYRWTVTYNEWVRDAWFKRAESFARQEKTFFFDYPDLLEFLLLRAGSIEIRDKDGRQVLARIDHIPFVGYVFGKIDRLLEHTSTDEHEPPAAT